VCLSNPATQKSLRVWKKRLWSLAKKLLTLYDKEYAAGEFVVQFSKICSPHHYVPIHTDDNDISFQYHITVGDYENVFLECYDPKGNIHSYYSQPYLMLKMDGRLKHQVRQVNMTGNRYCIIFYKLYDCNIKHSEDIFFPPDYVS
jgi:hypothetical protein